MLRHLLLLAPLALWGAILPSCSSTPPPSRGAPSRGCGTSINDLAWLAGAWQARTPSSLTDEQWTEAAGGSMLGMSRSVVQGKTVFFEYLRIEARADGLHYIAHPKARPGVEFKLVHCDGRQALFANPQHDHPKRILYRLGPGDRLTARIEGEQDGKAVAEDFVYTRM